MLLLWYFQLCHHLIIDMEGMDIMEDIIHMDIIIITTIITEVLEEDLVAVSAEAGGGGGSSCACACACAGGGRAGCAKKDFYGTNLKIDKKIIKNA